MKNLRKYPRTYHLPWSDGRTSDDKTLKDISCFENTDIVVTVKMDGENTTLYHDYFHARSLDGRDHPSRSWLKNFHSTFKHQIPENYRICGENLFAKHSIKYNNLESYFYCFSVWEDDVCLSWKDTLEFCEDFGLIAVPTLYEGKFDEEILKNINIGGDEGYVVRNSNSFHYDNFITNIAKFVRKNHVQTDQHWQYSEIEKNGLNS
jgi:hypothetical protein